MMISAWKAVYDSVCGTSHRQIAQECQDACRVLDTSTMDGNVLIVCLADGAGSASHAAVGSELACDSFINIVQRECNRPSFVESVDNATLLNWCEEIRATLAERASDLGVTTRQLACTFLAAIVGESHAVFMQIGDGAIVIRTCEGFTPVFWPQSGEFAGTTNFLTDDRFQENLVTKIIPERIDELAGFTDGLERLVLRFENKSVHQPFLDPMLTVLRKVDSAEPFFEPLRQFLDSPKINDRTDDDKTLILATRAGQVSDDDAVP